MRRWGNGGGEEGDACVSSRPNCFSRCHLLCDIFFTQTQIMLVRDSTEKKKFLLWESEENEFETIFKVLLKCTWN